jgi:hypothetical protein
MVRAGDAGVIGAGTGVGDGIGEGDAEGEGAGGAAILPRRAKYYIIFCISQKIKACKHITRQL